MRNKLIYFGIFLSFVIAGCIDDSPYDENKNLIGPPEIFKDRNISNPPGTEYEFYNCSASFECWDKYGKEYSCYNYPDPNGYSGTRACARRIDEPCTYDSNCLATEKCWEKTFGGKGLCMRIEGLELPPDVQTETDKPQEEPPIVLSCETNTDCPNWQYNQYRCKEIFKYGNACVAYRAGGISGKTPGCTNDKNRDLINGECLPEDGEFCIDGKPYITYCANDEWCANGEDCVRKR